MGICSFSVAYGNEIDVNLWGCCSESNRSAIMEERMAEPEEERFQRDSDEWKSYCQCRKDRPFNIYNLSSTIAKLHNEVTGDTMAAGAMDIFMAPIPDYWQFVDYCVDHLAGMNEINQQKFKEILILLTPGLVSTRYMARTVELIGRDQQDVRATDIQHLPFCLDMFFYGAVRNGRLGRYALADMCMDAFHAPCLDWEHDEMFRVYDIRQATFESRCFDDWPETGYNSKSVWPNWK
jgi:hypothetical protein